MNGATPSARVVSIRRSLVSLKMARRLEILDVTLRRIEQGRIDGIEALGDLLGEELSLRENRRIKAALRMACLRVAKTLAGYDFLLQPSLDRNRILVLAGLDFIERAEVATVHCAPYARQAKRRGGGVAYLEPSSGAAYRSVHSTAEVPDRGGHDLPSLRQGSE